MRTLSTAMQAAITARTLSPAIFLDLELASGWAYAWTGLGEAVLNGNTYLGVGGLAEVGTITETVSVEASGTSLTLNGVDLSLYADSLAEVVTGNDAIVRLVCFAGTEIVDSMILFKGLIDQPTVQEDGQTISITIALESPLTNLQRSCRYLYSRTDQAQLYPGIKDSGYDKVEIMQDVANRWG